MEKNTATLTRKLFEAARKGSAEDLSRLLELLPEGAFSANERWETPLHLAVLPCQGNDARRRAALLLDAGTPVDFRNLRGHTPLHAACHDQADPGIIGLLLDRGARVDETDDQGRTALHLAVMYGAPPEAVLLLLSRTGAVDAADHMGNTALHWCAVSGYDHSVPVMRMLVERGAVPMPNLRGETPLMRACSNHKPAGPRMVRLLLALGDDPGARDLEGKTALELCLDGTTRALVESALLAKDSPEAVIQGRKRI